MGLMNAKQLEAVFSMCNSDYPSLNIQLYPSKILASTVYENGI